jgi:single-stranded-DNA-specific exonuclease
MENITKKWRILAKYSNKNLIDVLLENRGLKTKKEKEEFLHPKDPMNLTPKELGLSVEALKKAIDRIKSALNKKEEIIIYGDYDADGICSTAIVWETIFSITKNVKPYIPDRFSEGYGINPTSIENIKNQNPKVKLIITVDNGIVAFNAIKKANKLGIDVIITDHHQKDEKLPVAYSIVHTDKIAGSGVAWIFAREIRKSFSAHFTLHTTHSSLELAAIGTIADQLPLTGANRSIAKFGLEKLNKTKRPGLIELYREAQIKQVGTYEVNYLIAPRLNAMGRLEHAMDSLRLICTTDKKRAVELAIHIANINRRRQKIVDEVVVKALKKSGEENINSAIVISGDYHEGVIGLAAGKLVEEFGRPAIVFALGKDKSKASARSIPGYNIIEEIKKLSPLLLGAGGHPMAAGLLIDNKNIEKFKNDFQKNSIKMLTPELLIKSIKIDSLLEFNQINYDLLKKLTTLRPYGIGNPNPTFLTEDVIVESVKIVGSDGKHMKLILSAKGMKFDGIVFNVIKDQRPKINDKIDIVYFVEENIWNGNKSLQLKVKDIKLH